MFSRNVLKYFSTIGFDCLHSLCLYLLFLSCLNLNLKRFKLNLSFACRSKQCRICWSWREQTVWVGECWGWENLSTKISLQFAMQMHTCLRWMSLQVICFCKSRSLTWNSNEQLNRDTLVYAQSTCSWFASGAVCTSCRASRSPWAPCPAAPRWTSSASGQSPEGCHSPPGHHPRILTK